jgi:hypothetical protein
VIPPADLRGMGWRAWRLGGGISLWLVAPMSVAERTLFFPTSDDESDDEDEPLSRERAAAILAALGRERSVSR